MEYWNNFVIALSVMDIIGAIITAVILFALSADGDLSKGAETKMKRVLILLVVLMPFAIAYLATFG